MSAIMPVHYETLLAEMRDFVANSSVGRRLPSETQLVAKFHCARATAGKALRKLEQEQLIVRRRGAGTFVAGKDPVRYFLPGEELLTRQNSDGATARECLRGAAAAARERNVGLELMPLSPRDEMYRMDWARLNPLNCSSKVVLSDWFHATFPELARRSARVALLSRGNLAHGDAQYTRQWLRLQIDSHQDITHALTLLHGIGCRRIAFCGHYLSYCRELEIKAYREFAAQHRMPELTLEISAHETSYSGVWRRQIGELYRERHFDGLLIFLNDYLAAAGSLATWLELAPSVRIIAWNFHPELAPGLEPMPCLIAPERRMGYDAVAALLDGAPRGRRRIYPGEFCHLPADMLQIHQRLRDGER